MILEHAFDDLVQQVRRYEIEYIRSRKVIGERLRDNLIVKYASRGDFEAHTTISWWNPYSFRIVALLMTLSSTCSINRSCSSFVRGFVTNSGLTRFLWGAVHLYSSRIKPFPRTQVGCDFWKGQYLLAAPSSAYGAKADLFRIIGYIWAESENWPTQVTIRAPENSFLSVHDHCGFQRV